jgi:hypothetical protein
VRTRVLAALAARLAHRSRRTAPGPSSAELTDEADRALVGTDDAVRTSDQELGFAVARCGEHAAAPFSAALQAARAELAAAFRLRQLADEGTPAGEQQRRAVLTEICARCAEANRLLDEQSEAFDRFQDLRARATRVLAEVEAHAAQQAARLGLSGQILGQLAGKYTSQAVEAVAANPGQAADRLEFATASLCQARQALTAAQAGQAAMHLQAAEAAADQASDLLDGVEHLEAELTQAMSALRAALRETDTDVAEAAELPAGRPAGGRADLASEAEAAVAIVRGQLDGGPFDPLAALRALEQVDGALDRELAGSRAGGDRRNRARAVLDQAMLVARSSVTTAGDFIDTRRGGVAAQARTRLAEAQRHFRQAIAVAQADPESALTEAQRADALGQEARTIAGQDVARFGCRQAGPVPGWDGFGAGLGGAILGGILTGSPPRPGSFGGTGSGESDGWQSAQATRSPDRQTPATSGTPGR